ncbi:MAG: substrate-binding domain-containing protein [Sodalinema sp.]|uniref:GntR family transcriptional regulator n=1 Tax=Sodalinema sp. TaxID=3080550 RepID=UPI00396F6E09
MSGARMKKYEIDEEWVKTGMQSGRFLPADQLPSESQISAELSIARNSVRQALGNLAAQGFVETRQGVGTFCLAPAHAATGSRDIALICFSTSQYIFPDLVNGVQATLNRTGYHMILSQTACDAKVEREMLLGLRDRGIAGIVLEPSFGDDGFSNADVVRDLVDAGVPVVLVDNATKDDEFSSITMDDFAGGRHAASHLYERGHRDIGIVHDSDYLPKIRRRNGMVELLTERGVEVPEEWQVSYRSPHSSLAVQARVRSALSVPDHRPTAFCCSSDDEAMDVMAAATELGLRVPEDISIVGFDNATLASHGRVGLTTIDHPTRYIAELATNLLLHSIRYPEAPSMG